MLAQIYLASQSPRRSELLAQIGVHHLLISTEVDETPKAKEKPADYVLRLALEKAEAGRDASRNITPLPILAADTSVIIDDKILGKPKNRDEALEMMTLLSGRTHSVLTGVALADIDKETRCCLSISSVTFRNVSPQEATAYWQSGEPADKAGGYGIQGMGALFITRLEGSFSGVMGLPLFETGELLGSAGIVMISGNENDK